METQAAGGSFWSTFVKSSEVDTEACLETILQENPLECSVAALLDEEDIIQEFKTGNDMLMQRLVQKDALEFLIQLLTEEPPEGASEKRCYREPFVASELLACGTTKLTKTMTSGSSTSLHLLDLLFRFLVETASRTRVNPERVNPTLVGYFSRVVCALADAHPEQIETFFVFGDRKENVLTALLACLRWPSLAELLKNLLCREHQTGLPSKGLIIRLLRCLKALLEPGAEQSEEGVEAVAENVMFVMQEVFEYEERYCDPSVGGFQITRQITEPEAVDILVECALNDRQKSVASAALNILVTSVLHTFTQPQREELRSTDEVGQLEIEARVNNHRLCSKGLGMLERLLTKFLPVARTCLDRCIHGQGCSSAATPMGKVVSVGTGTLDIINCLTMLAMTGWMPLLKGLREQDLLARCLEIFFSHPWSSLLHTSTQMFFAIVMEVGISKELKSMHTEEAHRQELKCLIMDLVLENGFLDRVVAEFAEEKTFATSSPFKAQGHCPRVGYMGHLHVMLEKLESASASLDDIQCTSLIRSWDGYQEHVAPALIDTRATQEAALGGGVTERDRGMASSSKGGEAPLITISNDDLLDEPINLNAALGDEALRFADVPSSEDSDWRAIDQAVE